MKNIAIVGYKGKMGSLIETEMKNDYIITRVGKGQFLDEFSSVDLVIDFANAESSVKSAKYCLKKGIPLIIGATGQTPEENQIISEISKQIKIVKKANFSNGIEVLKGFVDSVVRFLPDGFKIIEKHHIHKKDKPSGTALELKGYIKTRFSGEVEVVSIREGEEMGEHIVIAKIGDEKLQIQHNVYSRDAFVRGVVQEVANLLS